ncbi:2-dehydropantoate 2-reductase N-terminal domain-containing protein [Streptomyces sp. NPDC059441]|uniref:2-dehydropantoate 2-reductase N-terminal domain-containing protein n=1 Tax=Streptomyces sp. NPDC059441 TaxID=3346829 RepID=UPI00368B8071
MAAAYDAVLPAVKAAGLEQVVDDMAAAGGPHSLVVPLLSGGRHVDVLTARFGDQAVLGGVSKVATTLDAQGDIVRLAPCRDRAHLRRPGSARPPARAHRSTARSGQVVPLRPQPHAPKSRGRRAHPGRRRPHPGSSGPRTSRRAPMTPRRRTVATTASPGHFPRSSTAPYQTGPGLSRSG